MKISQMNNDQAADAMIKMMPAVTAILEDKETKPLIEKFEKAQGMTTEQILAGMLPEAIAFCLKRHREDTYAIIAALTCKPVSAIGKMNFIQTVKEVRESIDRDLLDFFKSAGNSTANPGTN